MFPTTLFRTVALSAVCLLPAASASAEVSTKDRALVEKVSRRLLGVVKPVEGMEWPPVFSIAVLPASGRINAVARLERGADGKRQPRVDVSEGMLADVIQGDADRLAYILGHELSHVLLGHVKPTVGEEPTPFVHAAVGRERELAADRKGAELAAAAGFSPAGARAAIERSIAADGEYSPFEGLQADHPCWADRLALLDREHRELWQAAATFDNGVSFLRAEQFADAARCFRAVVAVLPDCGEAWGNLGIALLGIYRDSLPGAAAPLPAQCFHRAGAAWAAAGRVAARPGAVAEPAAESAWKDALQALDEARRCHADPEAVQATLSAARQLQPAGGAMNASLGFAPNSVPAKPKTGARFRLAAGLPLPGGKAVTLGMPAADLEAALGKPAVREPLAGEAIVRWRYPALGVEVLVGDRVLAICLPAGSAAPLELRRTAGGSTRLEVGMDRDELDRLLGDDNFEFVQLVNPDLNYRYYREAGVAVRIKQGRVEEIAVVQVPSRRVGQG